MNRYGRTFYSTVLYNGVQHSAVQWSTVQCCTMEYSTVLYSEVQYSAVQWSTVQCCTVEYSTVLYNGVGMDVITSTLSTFTVWNWKWESWCKPHYIQILKLTICLYYFREEKKSLVLEKSCSKVKQPRIENKKKKKNDLFPVSNIIESSFHLFHLKLKIEFNQKHTVRQKNRRNAWSLTQQQLFDVRIRVKAILVREAAKNGLF